MGAGCLSAVIVGIISARTIRWSTRHRARFLIARITSVVAAIKSDSSLVLGVKSAFVTIMSDGKVLRPRGTLLRNVQNVSLNYGRRKT